MTERLTGDYFDDMQKITRHYAKSNNIDLNTGGNDFQDIIDKLSEYEIAEEEGRLVVLLCKVGDIVYSATSYSGICKHEIRKIIVDKRGAFACSSCKFPISEFGKRLFLTREEAEKALEEMEKDE